MRIASVGGTLSRNTGKLKVVWRVGIYLMHAYKSESQLRFGFGPIVLLSVQDNTCKNKDVQIALQEVVKGVHEITFRRWKRN